MVQILPKEPTQLDNILAGTAPAISEVIRGKLLESLLDRTQNSEEFKHGSVADKVMRARKNFTRFPEYGQALVNDILNNNQIEQTQQKNVTDMLREAQYQQFLQGSDFSQLPNGDLAKGILMSGGDTKLANTLLSTGMRQQAKFAPLPPELQQAYTDFIQDPEHQGKSPQQLRSDALNAGLPLMLADKIANDRTEEIKSGIEERKVGREDDKFKLDVSKESKEYAQEVQKNKDIAHTQLRAIDKMERILKKANLGVFSFDKLVSGTPLQGLRSANSDEFEAASKSLFEGFKDIFGIRISDADLKIALGMVPQLGKSNEGNRRILKFLKTGNEIKIAKAKIADEIVRENGGYRPVDFVQQINERVNDRYGDEIQSAVQGVLELQPGKKKKAAASQAEKPAVQEGAVRMVTPSGQTILLDASVIEEAKRRGFKEAK